MYLSTVSRSAVPNCRIKRLLARERADYKSMTDRPNTSAELKPQRWNTRGSDRVTWQPVSRYSEEGHVLVIYRIRALLEETWWGELKYIQFQGTQFLIQLLPSIFFHEKIKYQRHRYAGFSNGEGKT